ncbi:hypothetical protein GGD46_003424 [Rhizobium lusitanum]|uniref:Uncharacterized protein n=1 Tax=Rhizobium lusitanum TaxID=293958 RepID=A0A7X0MD11_9HYPH|nr:hypothetical protein [Rhizobium lusitanum]
MWKAAFFIMMNIGLAAPAMAIERYDTRSHSCEDVQALLARDKQAILRFTSRDGRTTMYDRYVATSAQCGPGLYGVRVTIPASNGMCQVVSCRSLSEFAP